MEISYISLKTYLLASINKLKMMILLNGNDIQLLIHKSTKMKIAFRILNYIDFIVVDIKDSRGGNLRRINDI